MLTIENINKVNKFQISRMYCIEVIIPTPYVYYFQLKNRVNANILIAELDREANQNGKYKLSLYNKSDYLTLKDLRNQSIVMDRIKHLI